MRIKNCTHWSHFFRISKAVFSKRYLVIQVPHHFHSNEILCNAQSVVRYVKRQLHININIYKYEYQ